MNSIPVHKLSNNEEFFEVIKLKERNSYDSSKAHKHSYFEIFLFQKGGGSHDIDFVSFPILTNSVHFVFPNQVHKVTRELDTFGFVILISKEFLDRIDYKLYVDLFSVYYLDPVVQFEPNKFDKTIQLLNSLVDETQSQELNSEQVIENYLNILFHYFLREKEEGKQIDNDEFRVLIAFFILIENNFEKQKPTSFYGRKLSVSERSLNQICKTYRNKTASVLIKDRMILEIKKMLLNSNQAIKEIAYSLSFNDSANFNKYFKSAVGISPSQFREDNGN